MSSRPRRSQRAPKKASEQISEYNVGDLVEINRGSTTVRARLAQLLTEARSPNPRWLIKVEGQPYKDEEVYEHTFVGKVLSEEELEQGASALADAESETRRTSSKSNKNSSQPNSRSSSESEPRGSSNEAKNGGRKKRKAASVEGSADDSSSTTTDVSGHRVSAREQRSRRRQAIIDEAPSTQEENNNKRKLTTKGSKMSKRSRGSDNDEECVKVKLLTGTLYLYRGPHRRAEFVRRV